MTKTQSSNENTPTGMRTFLIIWLGQLVSIIGSGFTGFALGVWIYETTGKALPFAMVALFGSLPAIVLSPIAGALVDRWNRRWVMIIADAGAALTTLALFILFTTGQMQVWHLYVIVLLGAICGVFQEPAYQASVAMLVPKDQLGRASGMMQAGGALGALLPPILAGFLYVWLDLNAIFLIDFATFFAAVGALMLVRIPQPERSADAKPLSVGSLFEDVQVGLRYLTERQGLITMLVYFALVNFLLNAAMILNQPLVLSFAEADSYGVIQSLGGLGMLVGSIAMGAWGGLKVFRMRGVYGFIALGAVALLVIGLRPSVPLIALGFFMFMSVVPMASGHSQVVWQTKVEPAVQGRVFATRQMISRSMMPLAFLLSGVFADTVFEPLMQPDGALGSSVVGDVLGAGPGRGVGLIFVGAGLVLLVVTAVAYLYKPMREVETLLPDVVRPAMDVPVAADENTVGQAVAA